MTAWTAPRTWVTAEVPTKAIMDVHLRDNMLYLKEGVDVFSPGGRLLSSQVDVTGVANSGSELTSLLSYTVPADTLSENEVGLYVVATGRLASNANVKRVVLGWGSLSGPSAAQPLDTGNNISQGGNFRVEAWIFRYGVRLQYAHSRIRVGSTAPAADLRGVDRAIGAEDETAGIAVGLAGFSTAGSSQVFGHSLAVYLVPKAA